MSAKALRVFKTAWFTKAAKKARIGDLELCAAVEEAKLGQADDLGGGVFKKRLNDNMHRSLILAKGRSSLGVCVPVGEEGPSEHLGG